MRTAFPEGNYSWAGLDFCADRAADSIEMELSDLTDQEKMYVLGILDDYVSNSQWDLAPKEYTDRELTFQPPTPMVCDHCGEPVMLDHRDGARDNSAIWYVHTNGFFGCGMGNGESRDTVATIDGRGGTSLVIRVGS